MPFLDFPVGEGPPLLLSANRGRWDRLGFGQARLVEFGSDPGGAFAFGLVDSVVVIWMHLPEFGPGGAYCYHAPLGPIGTHVQARAVMELGCDPGRPDRLYAVIASGRDVTADEERVLLQAGIHDDKLFVYSGAFLSQFGVSSVGIVGEAG